MKPLCCIGILVALYPSCPIIYPRIAASIMLFYYIIYINNQFHRTMKIELQVAALPYRVSLLDITETRIVITVYATSDDQAMQTAIDRTNGGHDAYLVW